MSHVLVGMPCFKYVYDIFPKFHSKTQFASPLKICGGTQIGDHSSIRSLRTEIGILMRLKTSVGLFWYRSLHTRRLKHAIHSEAILGIYRSLLFANSVRPISVNYAYYIYFYFSLLFFDRACPVKKFNNTRLWEARINILS